MILTKEFIDHVIDKQLGDYPKESSRRDYQYESTDIIEQDKYIRKLLKYEELELCFVCDFWCAISNSVHSSYLELKSKAEFYTWLEGFVHNTELELDKAILEPVKQKLIKLCNSLRKEKEKRLKGKDMREWLLFKFDDDDEVFNGH